MQRRTALFALTAMLASMASLAAKTPMQPVPVTTAERVDFTGGIIRFNGSEGELNVEGWDQPDVEVTLTRSVYADAAQKDRDSATKELKRIVMTAERQSNGDLVISTKYPYRNPLSRLVLGKTDAQLNYRIMVPRDAHVVIHHDTGDVVLYNLSGDIDATTRIGDILLQVPDPGKYAIDAKCKFGDVYTDFEGKYRNPFAIGEGFAAPAQAGAHKVRLRVGIGGIKIQQMAPGVAPSGTR